jgi:hypothetical protein
MDTVTILEELVAWRNQLTQAITALRDARQVHKRGQRRKQHSLVVRKRTVGKTKGQPVFKKRPATVGATIVPFKRREQDIPLEAGERSRNASVTTLATGNSRNMVSHLAISPTPRFAGNMSRKG